MLIHFPGGICMMKYMNQFLKSHSTHATFLFVRLELFLKLVFGY